MELKILLIGLVLVNCVFARPQEDYYDYDDFEPADCSIFKGDKFRCVQQSLCPTNQLTVKSGALDLEALRLAQASVAICPPSPGNNPRAAKLPGACCHEANIIHDCSDPEFKNEGFKCVEKGQCFDKFGGKSNSGVKFNEVFIKAEDGRCPSKNQICCRKDEKPKEEFAKMETCEDHEGYECSNPRACEFDNPLFPILKRKLDKSKKVENTIDILFAEDELFSGSNTDGKNIIQQNNELSLCDRALDICCHRKTVELHGETVIDTTTKSTTTSESTLLMGVREETIKASPIKAPKCGLHTPDGLAFAVVKDKSTQEGEWPHTCLMYKLDGGKPEYFGGATLIAAGVLVTAAHEVEKLEPDQIRVRCGEWDLRSDQEWFVHQDREVESFSMHPKYFDDRDKLWNDIALVHVKNFFDLIDEEADENLNIVPICLPKFDGQDFLTGNDDCVAMGWGKAKSDADGYEVSMKQIKLPMVPNDQCQQALRDNTYLYSSWKLHSSFVCAGGIEDEDACDGDGGGPLVCRAKDDPDRYMLTGIISWGIGCGTAGVPGVYASVQKALCFIDYATKCKHGQKYTNFYDYKEDCSNWIDETIDDLSKKRGAIAEGFFEKAQALKDSCEA